MLRRERPDAPLNGIVVTVSCSPSWQADGTVSGLPRRRIASARSSSAHCSVLEVRLPLHILVTKCDVLAGFRSFAENLPTDRRNDIFGWANPNPIGDAVQPVMGGHRCEALSGIGRPAYEVLAAAG